MIKALIGALCGVLLAEEVAAHEWYDPWCCNEQDCKPVPMSSVHVTRDGYFVDETSELIPYRDSRIRPSGDSQFHTCTPYGSKIRCLYVPAGGM